MTYHKPVLLEESIKGLAITPDGVYIDATFGGGGHSKAILEQLGEKGRVIGFDQDESARENVLPDERFTFIRHSFRYMKRFLKYYGVLPVQGVLADLGVASYQIDTPEKGFSTRYDAPLDMRMDSDADLTAQTVINQYSQDQLQLLFQEYGELRKSKTLARTIVKKRQETPITRTQQLVDSVKPLIPQRQQSRYLAQLFQALRIEVNDELNALKDLLRQGAEVLDKKGRMVVLSYHSLEDRIVKRYFKSGRFEKQENEVLQNWPSNTPNEPPFRPISKKPITPTEKEQEENPRARSAKLRIAEKRSPYGNSK